MLIYNTMTKKREEFIPIDPPNVNFYMCGPTVYDYFHIGNGRSWVTSDIIRRYLIYKGYNVKFVMNLTDVDDKIIKKSIEEKSDADKVAERYINAFFEDIEKLKVLKADVYPKATGHMNEIIDLIKKLVEKNSAYDVNGDVFYDVSTFDSYGKLSGKKIDELESGARVEINENKKNPFDFSLWKKAKEDEPAWDSPWGRGRPGWHIECSAMSTKHLGETIDIHAGGNDLIFPHHENEIAQSEAASGKEFVKYWIHFGFLNLNDEKMSKSLGNFFTARDILEKYSGETIRLLFCQTHYRGPMNFSDDLLSAAEKGHEKLINFSETLNQKIKESNGADADIDFNFEKYVEEFELAMDDDFNSPRAVAVIFDFIKDVNRIFAGDEKLDSEFLDNVKRFIKNTAGDVLGIIDIDAEGKQADQGLTDKLIEILIELRQSAKAEKNYALADTIRDKLAILSVTLKDGKSGTTYTIKSK